MIDVFIKIREMMQAGVQSVHPTQRYGVIFGGAFKGMQMDIDHLLRAGVAKNNDLATLASFNASQGPRQSANEHLVPEQLFDDPNTAEKEVEGVSAVKAIQIAQEQGQTIYTINKDNYSQVLPKLKLSSSVLTDIRNAVNAGRVVTAHERNISVKGWSGSGYIIIDPNTGTGAYLIDGGANGGYILGFAIGGILGLVLGQIAISAFTGVGLAVFSGFSFGIIVAFTIITMLTLTVVGLHLSLMGEEGRKCAWKGFKDGMTISGSFLAYFSFIQGWGTKLNFFKKIPNIVNILLSFFGIGTGIEGIDENTKECIK